MFLSLSLLPLLGGCLFDRPLRMDILCMSYPQGKYVVTDCADRNTWDEYRKTHKQ